MKLGTVRRGVDVADEYLRLAQEDESTGLLLQAAGHNRHAVYFLLQAMEKYVRAKIFERVDPHNASFRNQHRNHSVDDAVDFFVQVASSDVRVREKIRLQLDQFVYRGIRFNWLHNDLRYPSYSQRDASYACLDLNDDDVRTFVDRLNFLKKVLADAARMR